MCVPPWPDLEAGTAAGQYILGILLDYVLALVMVFVTGVFLLASLIVSTVLPIVIDWVEEHLPESHVAGDWWNWAFPSCC